MTLLLALLLVAAAAGCVGDRPRGGFGGGPGGEGEDAAGTGHEGEGEEVASDLGSVTAQGDLGEAEDAGGPAGDGGGQAGPGDLGGADRDGGSGDAGEADEGSPERDGDDRDGDDRDGDDRDGGEPDDAGSDGGDGWDGGDDAGEAFAMEQGVEIFVDNFCTMSVQPQEFHVPAGQRLSLTYHNRSQDYAVDVWLSYGGGFLDLEPGTSWDDAFEHCSAPRPYQAAADISTACSSFRLIIYCD